MKKLIILTTLLSIFILSCIKEPEPEPELIRAYCYLYHLFPGFESIDWVVDGVEVPEPMDYAKYLYGGVILETSSEQIEFTVKHPDSGEVLATDYFTLEENKYYHLIFAGTEEYPVLLFQEFETSPPASGKIKFQFFPVAGVEDSIDVYMGATTPDKRVVTNLGFNELSDPFEANDYDVRAAIVVTKHSEEYNQDSVLLTFLYNDLVKSGSSYLTAVAPATSDTASELTLWKFELATLH